MNTTPALLAGLLLFCGCTSKTPQATSTPPTKLKPQASKTQPPTTAEKPIPQTHGDPWVRALADKKTFGKPQTIQVSKTLKVHLHPRKSLTEQKCSPDKKTCVTKASDPLALVMVEQLKKKPSYHHIKRGLRADEEQWSIKLKPSPVPGLDLVLVEVTSSGGEDNYNEWHYWHLFQYDDTSHILRPLWDGPGPEGGNLMGECLYGISAVFEHRPKDKKLIIKRAVKFTPSKNPEVQQYCEKPKPRANTTISLHD